MGIISYFNTRNVSLSVVAFAVVSTAIFQTTELNVMEVATPTVLSFAGLLLSYSFVHKILVSFQLGKMRLPTATNEVTLAETPAIGMETDVPPATQHTSAFVSCLDRYESLQAETLRKELERKQDVLRTVNEYVTDITAGYLSKKSLYILLSNIEQMACGDFTAYKPLRSDMEKTLKSPDLRHLAWNVGERLGVSRQERAKFILASFPYELQNATVEYLEANLRDTVPCHIKIDVPDKGDYHFHSNG